MGQGLRVAGFDLHPIARARAEGDRGGRAPDAVFLGEVFHAAEQIAHDAEENMASTGPFVEEKWDMVWMSAVIRAWVCWRMGTARGRRQSQNLGEAAGRGRARR